MRHLAGVFCSRTHTESAPGCFLHQDPEREHTWAARARSMRASRGLLPAGGGPMESSHLGRCTTTTPLGVVYLSLSLERERQIDT